ncbi:MAG: endonuclease III [Proteobacteria bacterium]|nr:endonuclease III [Pseudomonadota bacterium]
MKAKNIEHLFRSLVSEIPQPKSDLQYKNNFQLLVAVILSAQATDVSVNKVTPALFKAAPTPEKMVRLGEKGIRPYIKTIGLFNNKAKNLYQCCMMLEQQHDSKIPNNRKALEQLPGVGEKTAGVVLNIAFDQAEIPVDTHVFRLANRTGLVSAKTPSKTEQQLKKVVPKWVIKKAHHLLILHGRYVCKARKPLCEKCCIYEDCEYNEKS